MPSSSLYIAVLCLLSGAPLTQAQPARTWELSEPMRTLETARHQGASERASGVIRPAAYQSTSHDATGASGTPSRASNPADPHREIGASPRKPGTQSPPGADGEKSRSTGPLITTTASLAVVVGLFLLVMWLVRRHLPRGMGPLPSDALEVLGRAAVGHKQSVTLLRLGDRLLLVALNAGGMETLCEIADPDEVTRLVGICRQAQPQSATTAFRQVLQQMSGPPRAAKAEDRHA